MAVLRPGALDGRTPSRDDLRTISREYSKLLRREDSVAVVGDDVLVTIDGCLSTEAAITVRRLQATATGRCWSAGIAIWDHAETEDALLQRALDAAGRAHGRPGSIVMAAAPRHSATISVVARPRGR